MVVPPLRPEITGSDHDFPGIDTMTDFAPELSKEEADDSRDGKQYTLEPPYLFNDNKGTTQTVNNPVTNSASDH